MNNKIIYIGAAAVFLAGVVGFSVYSHFHNAGSMNIATLAQSGASEAQLLEAVDRSAPSNPLTPDDVIALHKANVSDKVVIAMIQKNAATRQLAKK